MVMVKKSLKIVFGVIAIILIAYCIFILIDIDIQKNSVPNLENKIVGIWQNLEKNITITFYSNKTFITQFNNITYTGIWKIEQAPWNILYVNWEGFPARYILIFSEQEKNLLLSGYSEGTHNLELIRIE